MRIGVITDEVTQDFKEALEFAREYKLDCVELRSAWERGPFDYTDADIEKIAALSDEFGIPVTAISTPVFKCEYSEENVKLHVANLSRLIGYAKRLGATKLRCFDFLRSSAVTRDMIKAAYAEPIRMCKAAGITIVIESEPTTNSSSMAEIAELIKKIDDPTVRGLYDPGNNIYSTDELPYPDGFEIIRPYLAHVHVKDAVLEDGAAVGVAVGEGLVDYVGIFTELKKMGYDGEVMLETHYRPKTEAALSSATLANPKGSAISDGGYAASAECMVKLRKIIDAI